MSTQTTSPGLITDLHHCERIFHAVITQRSNVDLHLWNKIWKVSGIQKQIRIGEYVYAVCMNESMYEYMYVCMNEWMDEWMNEWTNEWM